MSYGRDQEMYCGKEKKRTKHTKCPNCGGSGSTMTTHCGWRCQDGYSRSNGLHDRYHK